MHSLLIDEHDYRSNISDVLIRASSSLRSFSHSKVRRRNRYSIYNAGRKLDAISPGINRAGNEAFPRENGATQRARRRGCVAPLRSAPLCSAPRDATTPARRHVCMRRVYVEKGLTVLCHRGISWVGVQTLLCSTRARTLVSGIFFSPRMHVRVEAVIFSVLRERFRLYGSQFLFKAVAFTCHNLLHKG